MAYTITGTMTYSSQANRDAARTRLDTALSLMSYTNFTSVIGTGVANSGTTVINVSISLGDAVSATAAEAMGAVLSAATASNRHTSGYLAVNYI